VNQPIPAYWTDRDYLSNKQIGSVGTSIDFFAGRLGYKLDDGSFAFTVRLLKGTPNIKFVTPETKFEYHSAIDKSWKLDAAFPLVVADANGSFAYDYDLTDVAMVMVSDDNIPSREDAAKAMPSLPTGKSLWWVQNICMSIVSQTAAKSLGGGTTVTGSGFKVNGSAYDSNSGAAHYPAFSVFVQPMNEAADKEMYGKPPVKMTKSFVGHPSVVWQARISQGKPIDWTGNE
jgi:hypothetical protein